MLGVLSKIFLKRRNAYRELFLNEEGKPEGVSEIVLADLKKFCRADRATFTPGDPHVTSLLEGRREVWNRIQNYINMSEADIYQLQEKVTEE